MTEGSWTKEELETAIETATTDHWSKNHHPLLLSELGMDLTTKRGDYRPAIAPLKLRQFIATQLSNKVVVVTHPRQAQKIALIPVGENFSFIPSEFEKPDLTAPDAGEKIKTSIWAAFVKPLAPNVSRYVDIDGKALRFQDVPNGSAAPFANARGVARDQIIDGQSADYNAQEVAARIKKWAAANGLAEERLYNRDVGNPAPKNSFFDVFKGLSDSDLRRIEIPFDIVMKLARQ
ncbi:hypothetical protein [Ensifer sp. Root558]|uniref:hypothetical protein n=1 Tax=Ensifer sp. Root558 TaxID=1736558 RepID=UPI000715655E|nr:hypothetical protein [Ensifer sp. Root558]KQZ45983.1 hypothetical protein ASD63_12835 [Ensifer sp. Root558]